MCEQRQAAALFRGGQSREPGAGILAHFGGGDRDGGRDPGREGGSCGGRGPGRGAPQLRLWILWGNHCRSEVYSRALRDSIPGSPEVSSKSVESVVWRGGVTLHSKYPQS